MGRKVEGSRGGGETAVGEGGEWVKEQKKGGEAEGEGGGGGGDYWIGRKMLKKRGVNIKG